MDREIPSVPITILAGVASLTDLLPEMPLPTPLPQTLTNKSLLFHPRVAEEAQNLLGVRDDALLPQLIQSLEQTSAAHIQVNHPYDSISHAQSPDEPELLRAMLDINPNTFFNQPSYPIHHILVPRNYPMRHHQHDIQQHQQVVAQPLQQVIAPQPTQMVNHLASAPTQHQQLQQLQHLQYQHQHTVGRVAVVRPQSHLLVDSLPTHAANNVPICEVRPSVITQQQQQQQQAQASVITSPPPATAPAPALALPLPPAPAPASTAPSNITEQLRQLRRQQRGVPAQLSTAGASPAQASDAPPPSSRLPTPAMENNHLRSLRSRSIGETPTALQPTAPTPTPVAPQHAPTILQPVVRLQRISAEDQLMLQKSLLSFAETKPKMAQELGISGRERLAREKNGDQSDSDAGDQRDKRKTYADTMSARKRRAVSPTPREAPVAKPKLRRLESAFVPIIEKMSIDDLMGTNTYERFNRSVDTVLRFVSDLDPAETVDEMVPDEHLLPRHILQELVVEAAKLKNNGAMEMIPIEKTTKLLHALDLTIRGADRVCPISDDDNEAMRQLWMETAVERVLGAADASLTVMHVLTAANMPKRAYIEDVIERVLLFVKYQMMNTIFPSYDSTYRVDSRSRKNDGRKKKSGQALERTVKVLYTKICELVSLIAELLNIQVLTDTSVLHGSSLGVPPFFTENVSELQLSCLKLVTTIFTRYEKHRRILLDDILASIARLPSTKRSLRTYKISGGEHIQMLTALVLQLIQCIVLLPESLTTIIADSNKKNSTNDTNASVQNNSIRNVDKDVLICSKYREAITTAGTFLSVFLSKCGSKNEDIDYRPLFENFVQDLLSTVNKPEWPATELLLSLLGKLLVANFTNKSTEAALRVASLDYLGVVCARLRRDSVSSRYQLATIDQMVKDIRSEERKDNAQDDIDKNKKNKKQCDTNEDDYDRVQFLQRVLLDFLAVKSQHDEAFKFARHFYIAQWYKECSDEKSGVLSGNAPKGRGPASRQANKKRPNKRHNHRIKGRSSSDEADDSSDLDDEDEDANDVKNATNAEVDRAELMRALDERKRFLVGQIRPFREAISGGARIRVFQTYIEYSNAELIAQYLASKRYFSHCFDQYLRAILNVLKESSIAIRTKAMKCLTMIVEADPSVLARQDMQMGVNLSFLDHSTSVREAAVDLVGKFVLSRPELIDKYYEMLSARILDTGVSVRKRVIKILKDICVECPDFAKVPEICVKMIRRVNDEEGIRKLVMEVFQNMWFTPSKDAALLRKVMNITDVVASSQEIGMEWFEQLLISLFRPKEDKDDSTRVHTEPPRALLHACKQIVDCLIENVLQLEETTSGSQRLVACLTTLYLFAKIRPQLLVWHASTLQPYLSLKCQSAGDVQIISSVARMLELVVPLIEHPSDSFLAQLEEDSMKLVLQHDRPIVASCLSCLGSIVNNVTRNFKLIRDCFKKYYDYLDRFRGWLEAEDVRARDAQFRRYFRRALFTVGLLLRHFDFKDKDVIGDLPPGIKDHVFATFSFFLTQPDDDIQANTLKAIGSICIRHHEFMLQDDLKAFYHRMLTSPEVPLKMKSEVLINIESYLMEEENRMVRQDLEWAKRAKQENLKEMGDVSSGMASAVIQLYLKEVLHSYLHADLAVRQPALRVIQLILQQGLVHPVQIVPYLICMSTDCEKVVSHSADKQLLEIEKKYPGFIHTKASLGIRLSYELQRILQTLGENDDDDSSIVRGSRVKEAGEQPAALNAYLYSILRGSRQQRRALVLNILKQFDDQARASLSYMLYLADNLAYFPYMVQDEPLFIVHHIDVMISVTGTNLLQSFREGLLLTDAQKQQLLAQQQQMMLTQQQQIMMEGDPEDPEVWLFQQQQHNPSLLVLPQQQQPQLNQVSVISALDEDDEDEDQLAARVPEDAVHLQACITAAQGCLLLLVLKQHLKDIYGLSDGKIQQYSPSEPAKVYEKNTTRRTNSLFSPKGTVTRIKLGEAPERLDFEGRKDLIRQYLDFKQLMLQLDPDDAEDDADNLAAGGANASANLAAAPLGGTAVPGQQPSEQIDLQNSDKLQPSATPAQQQQQPRVPKLVISSRRLDSQTQGHGQGQAAQGPLRVKQHVPAGGGGGPQQQPQQQRKSRQHKKKRRKFVSSGEESENDFSDPDFLA